MARTFNVEELNKAGGLVLAVLIGCSIRAVAAEHHGDGGHTGGSIGHSGGGAERGGTSYGRSGGYVDRSSHGSVRHFDSHVIRRPVEVHRDIRVEPRHEFWGHRDVDVDFGRHHFWHDFSFGRHIGALPLGFLTLNIGGAPYYYADGIYFQPSNGGYQEVYPPVGADGPQPPEVRFRSRRGG